MSISPVGSELERKRDDHASEVKRKRKREKREETVAAVENHTLPRQIPSPHANPSGAQNDIIKSHKTDKNISNFKKKRRARLTHTVGHDVSQKLGPQPEVLVDEVNEAASFQDHFPRDTSDSWKFANPGVGRISEAAPRFSQDERYVLFATDSALCVGSIEKSTIEKSLPARGTTQATSFAVADADTSMLACMGTADDEVQMYSAQSDRTVNLNQANRQVGVVSAVAAVAVPGTPSSTLIYSAVQSLRHTCIFVQSAHARNSPRSQLLKQADPILSLQVSRSARIVVALTPRRVLVGTLAHDVDENVAIELPQGLEYNWREISCVQPPTCIDFRVMEQDKEGNHDLAAVGSADRLDIAVGSAGGRIYVYSDVFGTAEYQSQMEHNKGHSPNEVVPRELHWHREAVAALAFSPDGNYIVSGGQETVLVLWQLDTGRKQFLPHLESPIRSLSVSPSGSMYAVGLADNSIMVLSTTELQPVAHFTSLLTPSTTSLPDQRAIVPNKEMLSAVLEGSAAVTLSSTINPRLPSHVLLAAPSYQSANTSVFPTTPSSSYLQTYDTIQGVQVSRQPLARNNATSSNVGPDGDKLREANIAHIGISPNGRWLATVDEWSPPADALQDLVIEPAEDAVQCARFRESHLRIWRWNDRDEQWMLNTTVPSPHGARLTPTGEKARLLALHVHPADNAIATIGEDGTVRVWAPRTSFEDGKTLGGDHATRSNALETRWALQFTVALEGRSQRRPLRPFVPTDAKLAWSEDGSLIAAWLGFPEHRQAPSSRLSQGLVLAASQDPNDLSADSYPAEHALTNSTVHFIDAKAGMVCDSRPGMNPSSHPSRYTDCHIKNLTFVNRFLFVLSRTTVHIWDLTGNVQVCAIALPTVPETAPPPLLSINQVTNTFAIAAPYRKPHPPIVTERDLPPHAHRDFASRLLLYPLPSLHSSDPALPEAAHPLIDKRLPHLCLSLLSAGGTAAPPDPFKQPQVAEEDTAAHLRRGYVIVDSNANVQRFAPAAASAELTEATNQKDSAQPLAVGINGTKDVAQDDGLSLLPSHVKVRPAADQNEEAGEVTTTRRVLPHVTPTPKLIEATGPSGAKNDARLGPLSSMRQVFEGALGLFWSAEE